MKILVIKNAIGHWGYCPERANEYMRLGLDDSETGLLTADDAIADAKNNQSVPADATFEVVK
jgi:hypothetical protein